MKRISSWALIAVIALVDPGARAHAGDTMLKLLKVLRDRGSLTEAEYQTLIEAAESDAKSESKGTTMPPAPGWAAPGAPEGGKDAGIEMPAKPEPSADALQAAASPAAKPKWFEKISFRGYAQIRYTEVIDSEGPTLNVPNDPSASEVSSFLLRRGRLVLSGDVTERLFVYLQSDFNASLSTGDYTLSMRDYYGDVALDADKEFRVRLGQSKVPFGWVNLQSSQNRAPMERPDGINSAVEGERDIGAFAYWAPAEIRDRFRDLVRSGLKGSGDYGVAGLGAYSGQGLNRLDVNGEPHFVARLSYPWRIAGGKQVLETGLAAYHGRFVSGVSPINLGSGTFTPTLPADGVTDERVAATLVWYPQPFGVEAEWNVGRGPELNPDSQAIESEFLHGGYIQVAYRIEKWHGDWYPFLRWNYFDGGRKFGSNAPRSLVNEWDVGLEWQPWPEFEIAVSYTRAIERTNTRIAPYESTENADRVGFQAQFNF